MLETKLVAIIRGKRYYEVRRDTKSLFTGGMEECKRFTDLHLEKEIDSQRNKRVRNKPAARIYRVWARPLAASGT